ncbi:MAG: HPF/RaiA family ribosome-associated protein [Acidimicrobiales bacterium]
MTMLVDVLGSNGSIADDVREKAVTKVGKLGKLAPLLEEAEVRLTKGGDGVPENHWVCHAVLRGHGHEVRGYAEGVDALYAVEAVVKKLEHQVERLKGKLIDRSHPRHDGPF